MNSAPGPGVCRRCAGNFSSALPECAECKAPICEECTEDHVAEGHYSAIFQPTVVHRFVGKDGESHYWRLRAANHEIIASSHRGWETAEECDQNVRDLADALISPVNVGVRLDKGSEWRWHADDDDGDTVGKSSEGFTSRQGADRNLADVSERLGRGFTICEVQSPREDESAVAPGEDAS